MGRFGDHVARESQDKEGPEELREIKLSVKWRRKVGPLLQLTCSALMVMLTAFVTMLGRCRRLRGV